MPSGAGGEWHPDRRIPADQDLLLVGAETVLRSFLFCGKGDRRELRIAVGDLPGEGHEGVAEVADGLANGASAGSWSETVIIAML